MPRIRDKRGQTVQELAVSPWITKKGLKEGAQQSAGSAAARAASTPCMYSVVLADAPVAESSSACSTCQDLRPVEASPELLQPQQHEMPLAGNVPMQIEAQEQQQQQQLQGSSDGGWHRVRRRPIQAASKHNSSSLSGAAAQHMQGATTRHTEASAAMLEAGRSVATSDADAAQDMEEDDVHYQQRQQQQQQQQRFHAAGGGDSALLLAQLLQSAEEPDPTAALQRLQEQQQQQQGGTLRGAAQLLLHPAGSISGQFIGTPVSSSSSEPQQQQQQGQGQVCLGLQGRRVLGIHSCYRDPEWALLQMSVIKYSSSKGSGSGSSSSSSRSDEVGQQNYREVEMQEDVQELHASKRQCLGQQHASEGAQQQQEHQQQDFSLRLPIDDAAAHDAALDIFPDAAAAAAAGRGVHCEAVFEAEAWVQRSRGDLVTLTPADLEDEDTEAAILQDSLGLQPDFVHVHFTAHTLLAGAAAERRLAACWPHMVGSGAVMNLGEMTLSNLPVGMLQEQENAAAL